jgi:predicted peptidase
MLNVSIIGSVNKGKTSCLKRSRETMKMKEAFAFTLLLAPVLISACSSPSSPGGNEAVPSEIAPTEPAIERRHEQSEHSEQDALVFETSAGDELSYLLYLPEALDDYEDWPMILYLHGSDANGRNIELLRTRSLPIWAAAEDLSQFIVVSPQLTSGNWDSQFDALDEFLADIGNTLPVDEAAIFVTGYSIGGLGSWQYAGRAPARFAGIVPVAGGPTASTLAPVPDEICDLSELPILIYQGDEDTAVPISRNATAVEALEACGSNSVEMIVYAGMGHSGTWQMAYADAELYAWMLELSR